MDDVNPQNSPTLAAHAEAAKFGINLSITEAAYIAEAVLAASGLREPPASEETVAEQFARLGPSEDLARVLIEDNQRRSQWFCVQCGKESGMYGHMGRCTPKPQVLSEGERK